MPTERVHIVFPSELVKDIDSLVGKRGRSKFLAEVAASEVRRRNLLNTLDEVAGSLRPGDYPEITRLGSVEYVRRLRKEWERPGSRRKKR